MSRSVRSTGTPAWRDLSSMFTGERVLTQNLIVGAGTLAAGILGVAFQVVVSHRFRPEDYGAVFAVVTLMTLVGLPASAFGLLMARESSRDRAHGEFAVSAALLRTGNRTLMFTGVGIGGALILLAPLLAGLLDLRTDLVLAAAVGIPFTLALPLLIGEFQGAQRFVAFSLLSGGQAGLKLLFAVALGAVFGPVGVIVGISLATAVLYVAAYLLLRRKFTVETSAHWWRPAAAYLAVIVPSTIALAVLLSADVLVVKHFFSTHAAGQFAAVAALGRAIFWGASGVAAVLFPKVILRQAQRKSGYGLVSASLILVAVGGLLGVLLLALTSTWLITAFAGKAYSDAAAYLPAYAIGMTLLGGVAVLIAAHQSRGKPAFLFVLLPLTALEPVLLLLFHQSIAQVVGTVDVSMALVCVALAATYVVVESTEVSGADASVYVTQEALSSSISGATRRGGLDPVSLIAESLNQQPLRILILNWRCPYHPRAGGAESYTYELARRLVASGHSVEWFSAAFPGASAEENIDGIRIVRAGRQWTVHWHAYKRYRRSLRERFDAVIDEVNAVPFFTPLWADIPTFMLIFQLEREVWWYQSPFPISAIGYAVEPVYLMGYRNTPVFTLSESTQQDLRGIGFKGPITLMPVGIDSFSSPRAKQRIPTFLYVGRLVPSKRVEHILHALTHFIEANGEGHLWLVGTGDPRYQQSLTRLAGKLGIEQHVDFCGHVSVSEKHRLMSEAHALLMTSVREGWGLVVTEANACGTPAIVYDVPGLRDSVRHEATGLVVPPDPLSLADAMARVFSDPDLYDRLIAEGRRWSASSSYDDAARLVGHTLRQAVVA